MDRAGDGDAHGPGDAGGGGESGAYAGGWLSHGGVGRAGRRDGPGGVDHVDGTVAGGRGRLGGAGAERQPHLSLPALDRSDRPELRLRHHGVEHRHGLRRAGAGCECPGGRRVDRAGDGDAHGPGDPGGGGESGAHADGRLSHGGVGRAGGRGGPGGADRVDGAVAGGGGRLGGAGAERQPHLSLPALDRSDRPALRLRHHGVDPGHDLCGAGGSAQRPGPGGVDPRGEPGGPARDGAGRPGAAVG